MITKSKPTVRYMNGNDLPDVMMIDELSFFDTWDKKQFLKFMRHRNKVAKVVRTEEHGVVAFMCLERSDRIIEIERFAVHPRYRRRGYGKLMLDKVIGMVGSNKVMRAFQVDIHDRNLTAQLFLRSQGVRAKWIITDKQGQEWYYFKGD